MSWEVKSVKCSEDELKAFKREIDAARATAKNERSAIVLAEFEDRWVGNCRGCARIIPKTKVYCPWCNIGD